ncbi:MAG: hypothetical protein ACRC5A_01935 [Enterobacteriaceae bacterium]
MLELIDRTPLTAEELTEQCFTLAWLAVETEHNALKESLLFILLEKISALLEMLMCSPCQPEVHP